LENITLLTPEGSVKLSPILALNDLTDTCGGVGEVAVAIRVGG
jgi:hypothetical protein